MPAFLSRLAAAPLKIKTSAASTKRREGEERTREGSEGHSPYTQGTRSVDTYGRYINRPRNLRGRPGGGEHFAGKPKVTRGARKEIENRFCISWERETLGKRRRDAGRRSGPATGWEWRRSRESAFAKEAAYLLVCFRQRRNCSDHVQRYSVSAIGNQTSDESKP